MTEIKRFVSYIYLYENGVKGNNVGFAKVDSRNGQCKIAVNIKGVERSNGKNEKVYLFYRQQEKIFGIFIGGFQIVNGIGEFHEQLHAQNLKATNLSLDEMNGILVREEDGNNRVYASGWDDYAIVINQFYLHNQETAVGSDEQSKISLQASEVKEKQKDPVIFFDRNWKEESVSNPSVGVIEAAELAKKEEKIEAIQKMVSMENRIEEETADSMTQEEDDYGRGAEKQRADFERDVKRGQKMDRIQNDGITQETDFLEKMEGEQEEKDGQKIEEKQEVGGEQEAIGKQEADAKQRMETVLGIEGEKIKQETGLIQETKEEEELEFMQQANGVETVIIEDEKGIRSKSKVHRDERIMGIDAQQNAEEQQSAEDTQEDGLLWGNTISVMWQEMSWDEYQKKAKQAKQQAQRCVQRQQKISQSEQMQQNEMYLQQGMNPPRRVQQNQMHQWQEMNPSGQIQQNGMHLQQGMNPSGQIQQNGMHLQQGMNPSGQVQQNGIHLQQGMNQPRQVQQNGMYLQQGMNQPRQVQQNGIHLQQGMNPSGQIQQNGMHLQQGMNPSGQIQQNEMYLQQGMNSSRQIQQSRMDQQRIEQEKQIESNREWIDSEQQNEQWMDFLQSNEGWQDKTEENQKGEEQEFENQMPEDMQELEETAWDRLCHQFPKIRAFVDEPESLCLKIDLKDLRILPQENWVLGNNSFLLHGYYNFRYLILTQEKGEIILGIPGIYHPNERMMASMFGFGGFKPVKVCDKMLGQFGYWYKKVTV